MIHLKCSSDTTTIILLSVQLSFSFDVKCESKLCWPTCKLENISCSSSSENKNVYCCFSCSFFSLNVFIFLICSFLKTHFKIKACHKKVYWFDLIVEVIFKIKIKVILCNIYIFFWGGIPFKNSPWNTRYKGGVKNIS